MGRWCVCYLHRESNCPLARAMDGHIMRCGTIGSCQSAATSEIVKRCWSRVLSCKWRYSKCPDLLPIFTFYGYLLILSWYLLRHPRRDSQAELTWVAGYIPRWFTRPKTATHPGTNRAQRRVSTLIETNALPLSQTANHLKQNNRLVTTTNCDRVVYLE